MDKPLYVAHIISSANDIFHQKTCSLCINPFIESYFGHFEAGRFVADEWNDQVVYHRQYLLDGYAPPEIIIDFIIWMQQNNLWLPWMGEFDQIALVRSSIGEV